MLELELEPPLLALPDGVAVLPEGWLALELDDPPPEADGCSVLGEELELDGELGVTLEPPEAEPDAEPDGVLGVALDEELEPLEGELGVVAEDDDEPLGDDGVVALELEPLLGDEELLSAPRSQAARPSAVATASPRIESLMCPP